MPIDIASATSHLTSFVPGSKVPADSGDLPRPAVRALNGKDHFTRGPGSDSSSRARLAEINAQHPNLNKEIVQAQSQAQAAAKRATWKGLKWYEKSLVFALPFGGLALAGIFDTLRTRAEAAQTKVGQLLALKVERDALAA